METKTINLNGIEMEFDFYEAETAGKYETSVAEVNRRVAEFKSESLSANIVNQCEAVRDCLDTIFGEGAGIKVCGDVMTLEPHLTAFEALIDGAQAQKKEMDETTKRLKTKFGNRNQRRNAAKK